MKTLVVCIDGTWNGPGQRDRDPVTGRAVETRTNVALTWEALTGVRLQPSRPVGDIAQLRQQAGTALYLSGVGSSGSSLAQFFYGATGSGLARQIRTAYRFLAERWSPGDRIYGFGFSRGAFAVRSLAGMIEAVGLPMSDIVIEEQEIARLYALYRRRGRRSIERPEWSAHAPVQFLGLWDTVGALALRGVLNGYHHVSPGNVAHVCHAVALDEERKRFRPEPWSGAPRAGQIVEEELFAGAHTNVGGGYCDARLSSISLHWVLSKARLDGLVLDQSEPQDGARQAAIATRRHSYTEFWRKCPVIGALAMRIGVDRMQRSIHTGQRLHGSVLEAMRSSEYRPAARGLDQLVTT